MADNSISISNKDTLVIDFTGDYTNRTDVVYNKGSSWHTFYETSKFKIGEMLDDRDGKVKDYSLPQLHIVKNGPGYLSSLIKDDTTDLDRNVVNQTSFLPFLIANSDDSKKFSLIQPYYLKATDGNGNTYDGPELGPIAFRLSTDIQSLVMDYSRKNEVQIQKHSRLVNSTFLDIDHDLEINEIAGHKSIEPILIDRRPRKIRYDTKVYRKSISMFFLSSSNCYVNLIGWRIKGLINGRKYYSASDRPFDFNSRKFLSISLNDSWNTKDIFLERYLLYPSRGRQVLLVEYSINNNIIKLNSLDGRYTLKLMFVEDNNPMWGTNCLVNYYLHGWDLDKSVLIECVSDISLFREKLEAMYSKDKRVFFFEDGTVVNTPPAVSLDNAVYDLVTDEFFDISRDEEERFFDISHEGSDSESHLRDALIEMDGGKHYIESKDEFFSPAEEINLIRQQIETNIDNIESGKSQELAVNSLTGTVVSGDILKPSSRRRKVLNWADDVSTHSNPNAGIENFLDDI